MRHFASLALAGTLARHGVTEDQAENIVRTVAELAHDEEAPERAKNVVSTYSKFEAGQRVTGLPALLDQLATSDARRLKLREYLGVNESPQSGWKRYSTSDSSVTYAQTDLGNAERLIDEYGRNLRFLAEANDWLVWNGRAWERGMSLVVENWAQKTVRTMHQQVATMDDRQQAEKLSRWAFASESKSRLQSMVVLARSQDGVPVRAAQLDAHKYLFNVANGTLDLRSGKLLPHDPAHLITKQSPVVFDPEARSTLWEEFLGRVTQDSDELVAYLQRVAGYMLTGDTSEQCLFFLYGPGGNGKSTFVEALASVLGDYFRKTPMETLLVKRSGGIPNDVASLAGARLVVCAEVPSDRRLHTALLKDLTGADTISARFLHQEFFEFRPECKLVIYGNHKPPISETDNGIWRRMKLIPFDAAIPPETQDKNLLQKLELEREAILNWAVQGCLRWQREGLGEPEAVRRATQVYRSEEDTFGEFLADCCVTAEGCHVTAGALYEAYANWCDQMREQPMSKKALGQAVKERGFEATRSNTARGYMGVGLLNASS